MKAKDNMKVKKSIAKKEYLDNRTSWKFYKRHMDNNMQPDETTSLKNIEIRIQLEILKELQYMNS